MIAPAPFPAAPIWRQPVARFLQQLVAEFRGVSILSQAVREFGYRLQPKWAQAMPAKLQQAVEEMRPVP